MQIRDTILFVWMIVTLAACVPQGGEKQETIAINPLDGECYVWIPPGTFQMGCSPGDRDCQDGQIQEFNNENPSHRVTISDGFWMSQTEVNIGAYTKYAQATQQKIPEELVLVAPERFRWQGFPQGDNFPMAYVTWEEAKQYCEWAGGRLPTEEGARLSPGNMKLVSGLATLRFTSGVEVVLEAPAEIALGTMALNVWATVSRSSPEPLGTVFEAVG